MKFAGRTHTPIGTARGSFHEVKTFVAELTLVYLPRVLRMSCAIQANTSSEGPHANAAPISIA
jgi:hypothetical protein